MFCRSISFSIPVLAILLVIVLFLQLQSDRQMYTSTPNSTAGSMVLLGDKRLLVKVVSAKDLGGKWKLARLPFQVSQPMFLKESATVDRSID